MSKYMLQRIILPSSKDAAYRDLFFRTGMTETESFGNNITKQNEYYFNTWMNLFASKKWFFYSCIKNLKLGLRINGEFSVEIIGSNRNAAYNRIDQKLYFNEFESDGDSYIFIDIAQPESYDAIYFILRSPEKKLCTFIDGGWYTETEPKRLTKLAVVSCTYKREDFIYNTINEFNKYLEDNITLQDRMHLFVIDNGQTLSDKYNSQYVDIMYNMNAGGAGGFGRGLLEVCTSKENYTRCLFIDDDVEIIPESFYRTIVLSDYLKEEYKSAFINGSMLDYYNKVIFYENLGIEDGLWTHPYHREANLLNYDEILRVNDIPEEVYSNVNKKAHAGWYYCSFPIEDTTINDLPLPIFIRGDDVEYSRRHFGRAFIQLNGICIWHAPFYYRVNKVTDSYYLSRNMFIINALYSTTFKNNFTSYYINNFRYAIATYDYVSANLIIEALSDILKGEKLFDESPLDIMKRVTDIAKENNIAVSDYYELESIRNKQFFWSKARTFINKSIKAVYKYCPISKKYIKREGLNVAPEWFPPADVFLIKKKVKVYNLLKQTYTIRSYDHNTEKLLTAKFYRLINEVKNEYDHLCNEYKKIFNRITSVDYWKTYLDL